MSEEEKKGRDRRNSEEEPQEETSLGKEILSWLQIIVAAGVRSAVAGMEGEGIVIDRGIKVDDYLQTGAEGVYAAGDQESLRTLRI